ncbi:hypothetical protein ACH5RR_028628 [Cinchona calisaya]|uniref:Ferritin-like superfamily n=1 Tax=Cinchona calisaya TaxID=153742 RepID=A0ABD2YSN2_9GENT
MANEMHQLILKTMLFTTPRSTFCTKTSHLAYSRWCQEGLPIGVFQPPAKPDRPEKPKLVSPKDIPSPKHSGLPLNAYMLHNLAHVELNAIDLAWDTVVLFSPYCDHLGEGFFASFAHVADNESRHFSWCLQRLAELGFSYGDMPAHNLLWKECDKTSANVAARLVAIPLVQEARGLDAGPRLVQKLIGFGDLMTSSIVARIADEELAHVAVGLYWFLSFCQKMGRAPCSAFKDLLKEYNVELKGPFNYSARDEAGIPRDWYDPSFPSRQDGENRLSEVYNRLACIVSMEQENSKMDGSPVSDFLDSTQVLAGQFPISTNSTVIKEIRCSDHQEKDVLWRLQAFGLPIRPPFCLSFPPHLFCGHHRLDSRNVIEYHMSLLHLRYCASGDGSEIEQSPHSCYEVVHLSNTMLSFIKFFGKYLIELIYDFTNKTYGYSRSHKLY